MKNKLVYIIDLDGTVWDDIPNEVAHNETATAKVFDNAVEWINKKYDEGNYICLFTARTEAHKKVTEDKLNSGLFGVAATRFGNFTLQSSDLILFLGTPASIVLPLGAVNS